MNSIERRLQIGLSLALLALFGLFWSFGSESVRALSEAFIASRLEHDTESVLAAVSFDETGARLDDRRIDLIYVQPLSGHYFQVLLEGGRMLSSRSLWDRRLPLAPLPPGVGQRRRVDGPAGQRLLQFERGYRKQGHNLTIAVAEDLTPLRHHQEQFRRNFALLALGGLVALLLIQGLIVRRAFRRLEPVRDGIRELAEGRRVRLSENVPREVAPLVGEMNRLLQLMDARLQRSRNALGNLTHALKGPLNLLTRYLDDPQPEQRQVARTQAERIRLLMERELKRARLAGSALSAQRFDPQRELSDLIALLQQVHRREAIEVAVTIDPDLPLFGDREDMLELFGNLLDNAFKWSSGRIVCRLAGEPDGVRIVIADDGTAPDAQQLERLSERGLRLDESVEGHGLGLSIVRDIVRLYGGRIDFSADPQLGGLRVELWLPREGEGATARQ